MPPTLRRFSLSADLSRVTPDDALGALESAGSPPECIRRLKFAGGTRAVTLVETMFAFGIMALFMLGFMGTFLQSRRVTEANILHAAATSLVYGIIEQIKGLDYTTLLPNAQPDPNDPNCPTGQTAPYYTLRVRINPDLTVWLKPVYNIATTDNPTWATPSLPIAPTAPTPTGAIDNVLGNLPLSTVTGTTAQNLALNVWIWIDEVPKRNDDVSEVKKITIIYTYRYNDGSSVRTVRDGEVFIRTRYDQ
jgi:hypothetical protein